MGGEVYADLLFLVNFSMDFLCFYLCARLLHRPLNLWRGVLASALGGVYAVAVLFLTVDRVPAFLIDAAVCVALCAVAMFGKKETWRALLRLSGLYLLISVLLGGVMTALFSQLNRIPGLTDRVEEEGLSTWIFFGLALLSAFLTFLWGKTFRRTVSRRTITVIIEQGEGRVELLALCDSGNLLRDPIGGRPVIPVEGRKLESVLPKELLEIVNDDAGIWGMEALPPTLVGSIRLIPAQGVTGERLLIAFSPEHLYLRETGGEEREVKALIAPTTLSEANGGITALVPSELMME